MASDEQTTPVLPSTGLGAAVAVESGPELGEAVRARGYWEQIWLRLRRDRLAIGGGIFVILLVLLAFVGAPLAARVLGHGPNDIFIGSNAIDDELLPAGPWTHVTYFDPVSGEQKETLFVLGAADQLGRDEFLRILYGAQVSLEVAVLSTIGVMVIGVLLGSIAGYYRGWQDTIISRVTDVTMAFPTLLFLIALTATVGPRLDGITFGIFERGVVTLVLVFTLFGWFAPCRIMRAQTLSVREKEYIEAAQMVGASDWRVLRSHVIPHLVAPIIVFSTLIVAAYVGLEAGLSFLGLGIKSPTASWGNLLADAPQFYTQQPWLMVWPGMAVLLTTLAFNLLGDGLRDAFDPRSSGRA
jgi:peptide/nickel transport system permease protein